MGWNIGLQGSFYETALHASHCNDDRMFASSPPFQFHNRLWFVYRNPWTAAGTVPADAAGTLPTEGGVWWSQGKNEVFHQGLTTTLNVVWSIKTKLVYSYFIMNL